MSNFQTLAPAIQGVPGRAPRVYAACTPDSLATITAVGYLNDLAARHEVKANDIFFINHDDNGTTSTLGRFYVVVAGSDYSLVAWA